MDNLEIRLATLEDAADILKIYGYYVENTAISFEYKVPELDEFKRRIEKTLRKYPYFVALINNKIAGFAYAAPFNEREAYKYSAELTVYIDKNHKKQGVGRSLYEKIEIELKKAGITNLYARIAVPEVEDEYLNFDSLRFHLRLGFRQVGKFYRCGCKFDRWYSLICVEKLIIEH